MLENYPPVLRSAIGVLNKHGTSSLGNSHLGLLKSMCRWRRPPCSARSLHDRLLASSEWSCMKYSGEWEGDRWEGPVHGIGLAVPIRLEPRFLQHVMWHVTCDLWCSICDARCCMISQYISPIWICVRKSRDCSQHVAVWFWTGDYVCRIAHTCRFVESWI